MKIKPLHDQVLVRLLPNETKTAFGILLSLPKSAPKQGEVVAVGPGLRIGEIIRPMSIKVGDKIIFDKFSGTLVGDEHLLLKEEEAIGIL